MDVQHIQHGDQVRAPLPGPWRLLQRSRVRSWNGCRGWGRGLRPLPAGIIALHHTSIWALTEYRGAGR